MSFVGAGANLIGGEIQGWANLLDQWAMRSALQNEYNKQGQYQKQALGILNAAIPEHGIGTAEQEMAQGKSQREADYASASAVPMSPRATGTSQDQAYGALIGQARANLGSYSDWQLNQAINDIKTQQQLNQISSFAGGLAKNVYPYKMYEAQHSHDWLSQIGAMISSIGGSAPNFQQYSQPPQGGGIPQSTPGQDYSLYSEQYASPGGPGYYAPTSFQ